MPRLILINGPPAAGKSTLAQRYADDHPLALNLDIDRVRAMIGGWRRRPASGQLARELAVAAAAVHLTAGHDVVIPQLVARPEFIARLESLAENCGAAFREVFLLPDDRTVIGLYAHRARTVGRADGADAVVSAGRIVSAGAVVSTDLTPAELSRERRQLLAVLADRPDAAVVVIQAGEIAEAYQELLDGLGDER